ncbi:hypothetical protein V7157_06215 [Neobacillus drentensis]|uniref:hypothetical protein n=1 Tax=Neobacillus drentensis TaxID=220684 RepID=UPI0030003730
MSKKRTKKQQRDLENGLYLFLLLVAGVSFYFTQKLYLTLMIVGVVVILIIVVVVFKVKRVRKLIRWTAFSSSII